MGRLFSIPALYSDSAELLERQRPDVVIIGTPPHVHAGNCLAALAAGAHVFCEKPFVTTLEEADAVIAASETHARMVVVNNEYRFMPIYRRVKEELSNLGGSRPYLVQGWQQMNHRLSAELNWRSRLTNYTLFEFGTHPLDLMCYFFDDLPLSITASTPRPGESTETDLVVHASLRFPGDRLAVLTLNRSSQAMERYLEMRLDCERASFRVSFGGLARVSLDWSRVIGRPIGRLSFVRGGEARVEAGGRSRVLVREPGEGRPAATAANLMQMLGNLGKPEERTRGAHHARELLRIVLAGYQSAASGETVWLRPRGT